MMTKHGKEGRRSGSVLMGGGGRDICRCATGRADAEGLFFGWLLLCNWLWMSKQMVWDWLTFLHYLLIAPYHFTHFVTCLGPFTQTESRHGPSQYQGHQHPPGQSHWQWSWAHEGSPPVVGVHTWIVQTCSEAHSLHRRLEGGCWGPQSWWWLGLWPEHLGLLENC